MTEDLNVDVVVPGDQRHQPGHLPAVGVGGEAFVQPAEPGGIQARAHAVHDRGRVMRCESSGSVPPWRLSRTSRR